jgi:hypothetical protein
MAEGSTSEDMNCEEAVARCTDYAAWLVQKELLGYVDDPTTSLHTTQYPSFNQQLSNFPTNSSFVLEFGALNIGGPSLQPLY